MTEATRTRVWESMLGADYLARYYNEICARTHRLERWLQGLVSLFASGAAVTLLLDVPAPWSRFLAFVVAAMSIYLMISKISQKTTIALQLVGDWGKLRNDFEELWLRLPMLDEAAVLSRWRELEDKIPAIDKVATATFPTNRKVAELAYAKTVEFRSVA